MLRPPSSGTGGGGLATTPLKDRPSNRPRGPSRGRAAAPIAIVAPTRHERSRKIGRRKHQRWINANFALAAHLGETLDDDDFTVEWDSVRDPLKPSSFEQLRAEGGRVACDAFADCAPEYSRRRQRRAHGAAADSDAAQARFKSIDKRLRHSLQRIVHKYEDFFDQVEALLLGALGGASASLGGVPLGQTLLQASHATSCHATSRHATLCHATSRHVTHGCR